MERKEKSQNSTEEEKRQTQKAEVTPFADLNLMLSETASPIPSTFKAPREITRQSTKPVPKQGNLLDILNPKARKYALELQENDSLFSVLTDGIDCNPLVTKVIIALSQVQFEQSWQTGNTKLLTGLSEKKKKEIEIKLETPLPNSRDFGEKDSHGQIILSPFGYIAIERTEFTKKVYGGEITGGKDIEGVMDILSEMERKEIFIDLKNGHFMVTKLLTIMFRHINPLTGKITMLIQLSPLFSKAISNDYVTHRSDILLMMKGNQKKITMKLYNLLIEVLSFRGKNSKQHNDKYFKIDKAALFDRIAVAKRYKDHPSYKEKDFVDALQKMKDWLLITDYREEQKSTYTMCIFTLNPDWKTAPTPKKYLPKEKKKKKKTLPKKGETSQDSLPF